jgi:hypothetical protein
VPRQFQVIEINALILPQRTYEYHNRANIAINAKKHRDKNKEMTIQYFSV